MESTIIKEVSVHPGGVLSMVWASVRHRDATGYKESFLPSEVARKRALIILYVQEQPRNCTLIMKRLVVTLWLASLAYQLSSCFRWPCGSSSSEWSFRDKIQEPSKVQHSNANAVPFKSTNLFKVKNRFVSGRPTSALVTTARYTMYNFGIDMIDKWAEKQLLTVNPLTPLHVQTVDYTW